MLDASQVEKDYNKSVLENQILREKLNSGKAISRIEENGILEDLNKQVLKLSEQIAKVVEENQQLKDELLDLFRRTHQYSDD